MSKDNKFKIILLGSSSSSTNILYNSLKSDFKIQKVIIEEKESKFLFFKRRLRKMGYLKLLDQLLFISIVSKFLSYFSQKRYSEILKINNLSNLPINSFNTVLVKSINELSTIDLINTEVLTIVSNDPRFELNSSKVNVQSDAQAITIIVQLIYLPTTTATELQVKFDRDFEQDIEF